MDENRILLISFILIIIIPLIFFICYFTFGVLQNYNVKKIIKLIDKHSQKTNMLVLKTSLSKVNGWNILSVVYSSLYYYLNSLGILLSIFGAIVAGINPDSGLIIVCCVLTGMIMCCNLFLKCDKKWSIYRKVLSNARVITNEFLIDINGQDYSNDDIKEYVNSIIELEKNIPENELL